MGWTRGLALICVLAACGDDSAPDVDASMDATETCTTDAVCDDGAFCNGEERCDPSAPSADALGCVPGSDPCGGSLCDEDGDRCDCTNPDMDGDGVMSAGCGGSDCDDSDPNRYPGNTEICDDEVDEDCDPDTLGPDMDGDGFVDIACCNATDSGLVCGTDCDDELSGINPGTPEACNGGDEDCDGNIDEGVTTTCAADSDNDGFAPMGAMEMEFCQSCTETENWASPARFPTEIDCDDDDPDTNPGATELCDGIDSNCSDGGGVAPDEDADEDGFASTLSACSGGLPKTDCNDRDNRVRTNQTRRYHVPHCTAGADVGCWDGTRWTCRYPSDGSEACDLSAEPFADASSPSWDFNCNSTPEPEGMFSYDCACTAMRCGERPSGGGPVAAGPSRGPAMAPEPEDCGDLVVAGQCAAGGVVGGTCGGIGGASCIANSSSEPVYHVRCR